MLKIGDFSRLSQIGIHALRNYDKLGLLQPEHTDKFTGYRYYTLNQLPRAHRIMALKEMGLSLEQIGIMLNQDMSIDELRGMFRLKQAEIEQRVREDQRRITMIEFHINMINVEDKMPELDVVVKEIESFRALFIKFRGQRETVRDVGSEMLETLAKLNVEMAAPQIDVVYGDEINVEDFEFAFIIPIDDSITDSVKLPTQGTLTVSKIPRVLAASVMDDPIRKDTTPHAALERKVLLQRWAIENGYNLCNQLRIVRHKGPQHGGNIPMSEWVSEWQLIIEKVDSAS